MARKTKEQWDRFFANGTHDRYLRLGDLFSKDDLADAKASLKAQAFDAAPSDQGVGVPRE